MYDAMPAFFKDAILKSYEAVGWDLGSSTFEGKKVEYPDFEVLAEQLDALIEHSDYASDIKSNYRGALITRVQSLTVGLNKFIFSSEQTPYSKLFDEYCILDIDKEERTMLTLSILIFMVVLLASVISIGIRLAWGATKFFFGLGLFWFCPLLFVLAVLFGGFSHTWLLIVIVGLLFGGGFRRI